MSLQNFLKKNQSQIVTLVLLVYGLVPVLKTPPYISDLEEMRKGIKSAIHGLIFLSSACRLNERKLIKSTFHTNSVNGGISPTSYCIQAASASWIHWCWQQAVIVEPKNFRPAHFFKLNFLNLGSNCMANYGLNFVKLSRNGPQFEPSMGALTLGHAQDGARYIYN